jgi:uncharacterized protein (DUF488 family)
LPYWKTQPACVQAKASHLQLMPRQSTLWDGDSSEGGPEAGWPAGTVFTIGHSTHPIDVFLELLRLARIEMLVDVRSVPRSRHNPQFNIEMLPGALAGAGIGYRHMKALGGLRHRLKGALPSPNGLWENEAFRNFADHAGTPEFRTSLAALSGLADQRRTAIMCAEALWWRCHRRIIADHLLAEGRSVAHILGSGKIEPARLTPGAEKVAGSGLVYPAPETRAKIPKIGA